MKAILKKMGVASVLWLACLAAPGTARAQTYEKLWRQVEQAQEKSLPQTVVKTAEEIYRKGERERNAPQMLRAAVCRDAWQARLTPDSSYAATRRMEQWAATEEDAANRAILHTLLAERYTQHMRSLRRMLQGRTEILEEDAPEDPREWSTNLFTACIDRHCRAVLQDTARLLATPVQEYVPFTLLGADSRYYGHDLYHLLARRIIDAYGNWRGMGADSLRQARTGQLYQEMMAAYSRRSDGADALLLCTLDYLEWKRGEGVEPVPYAKLALHRAAADEEYLRGLEELIARHAGSPLCAEVYQKKASFLYTATGSLRSRSAALQACDEGLKRYPGYARINELRNLREQILQPRLSVQTEKCAYPGDSLRLYASYYRLGGFTLQVYRTDQPEVPRLEEGITKEFLRRHARLASSTHYALRPLPREGVSGEELPYQDSDSVLWQRLPGEPGVYVLQVVPDAATTRTASNFLVLTRFKVLTLPFSQEGTEFAVVDSRSGQPVAGATVSIYDSQEEQTRKLLAEATTGSDGKAQVKWQEGMRSYTVRKDEDRAMQAEPLYRGGTYRPDDSRPQERLVLLTDRSLYRPGQTVQVKGIAYEQLGDSAQVLAGREYTVRLLDTNRKQVAEAAVRSGDFGSFTAGFTLPSACLNGIFQVEVTGKAAAPIRVEEYKRPTFDITFLPVKQAYALGDTLILAGSVKAYNGTPLQGLPVACRVTRTRHWYRAVPGGEPVAADTVRLDAEGGFRLPVALLPGGGAAAGYMTYSFRIEASVTSESGETQTSTCELNATRKAYRLFADIAPELCREESLTARFHIENQSGQTLEQTGFYRLYPLTDSRNGRVAEEPAYEGTFTSGQEMSLEAWRQLPSGGYRLVLGTTDRTGQAVDNRKESGQDVWLFSRSDRRPSMFRDLFAYEENTAFDASHPAAFLFGTSHRDAYVLMDVFCARGRIESRTLALSDTIIRLEYPYREAYGDGIGVQFSFVKEGMLHTRQIRLEKRRPDPELRLKWAVFRDRLQPGQEEEWRLTVSQPQGTPAAAELLATMYDASLDKIYRYHPSLRLSYRRYIPYIYWNQQWRADVSYTPYFPLKAWRVPGWEFDSFYTPWGNGVIELRMVRDDATLAENGVMVTGYAATRKAMATGGVQARAGDASLSMTEDSGPAVEMKYVPVTLEEEAAEADLLPAATPELRGNFAETAFFYPQLRTNGEGEVAFAFTMPQSLTRWNFRGYAHTRSMQTGSIEASAVTAKEFMLTPNLPRFVRTGDRTQVAASISNRSAGTVKGTAVLTLFDPLTEKVIGTQRQKFQAEAGGTAAVGFGFSVDERYPLLGVRLVADGGSFSDGEQHLLPVLSDKEYVTETLAMPIRGGEKRTFRLDSLFNRNSRTATQRRLTVEMTANPAWYAVQALPALHQPQTDNAIAWATGYYANTLAGHILHSQPRIKAVLDSWQQPAGKQEPLHSRLEQNQELKNILLEESPWLMEATTETERQRRLATLLDVNYLSNQNLSALAKLKSLQGSDGGWSWYPGMPGSHTITAYVTGLLVRLPLLTGSQLPAEAQEMRKLAFGYLHRKALEEYRNLRRAEQRGATVKILSGEALRYLYLVALSGEQVPAANRTAYDYFLSKVVNDLQGGSMERKAQGAVILQRAGRKADAAAFIASLKEHLVQTDELGAYFDFHATPQGWGMTPVPAHVAVMEALHLAGGNDALVEEMKLWLLKQKQTTAWNSPVATADAVYALLCQGSDLLASRGEVRITLGNTVLETQKGDEPQGLPGLGYLKESFAQGAPELKAKSVTVEKRDEGIAWGAVYAQYLSPLSDVRSHGGGLEVEKQFYVERTDASGKRTLQPLESGTALRVGDKLVSRLTLRLDRAMDFVQLKEQRAACLEPVESRSGYRRTGGMGYYQEVEDSDTNFFFDHLGKGTYVLEHASRVARGGVYQAGLATLQCAYAPEYAAHSAGGTVTVGE